MNKLKLHLCVTQRDRAKALIKHELNYLKYNLQVYLDFPNGLKNSQEQIIELSQRIVILYLDYLHLIDDQIKVDCVTQFSGQYSLEYFSFIGDLEQQLLHSTPIENKKKLIIKIINLYQQLINSSCRINQCSQQLVQVFNKKSLRLWLAEFINFWNQHESVASGTLFSEWNIEQQQLALNFFSGADFIDLVNAIFFYKIYPEQLVCQPTYTEKLFSVRIRLSMLHSYIELIQQQLYSQAFQHGLLPGIDYLFHGDGLPSGVMFEVKEDFREIIYTAIKKFKITKASVDKDLTPLTHLHDLLKAYKFWFNPNRLIDAVMVLQQILSCKAVGQMAFERELVTLFSQLSTTECIDLYGYFSNDESCCLLHTFLSIEQGILFDWLPLLKEQERAAIKKVYGALCSVMEALRSELSNRHITAKPYDYFQREKNEQIKPRSRDAIYRVITVYRLQESTNEDSIEQLFHFIEEAE